MHAGTAVPGKKIHTWYVHNGYTPGKAQKHALGHGMLGAWNRGGRRAETFKDFRAFITTPVLVQQYFGRQKYPWVV